MDLMRRLGLHYPIVQAPMAGGSTPPGFIAESIRLGLLGSLGAAYLAPAVIEAQVAEIRAAAKGPLGINLFLPVGRPPAPGAVEAMIDFLAPRHAAAGIAPPVLPDPPEQDFQAQLAALRQARPEVASFVFDCPDPAMVATLKAEGMVVIGGATTLDEARAVAAAGVDAVVAQGAQAGGHRASFLAPFEASLVPTLELVETVAAALELPVIAAGGIMDRAGISAALDRGAQMVQLGTALLRADESGAPPAHKAAMGRGDGAPVELIREWSGRAAIGLGNRFTRELRAAGLSVPPFPYQNALTQALRAAGRKAGDGDLLALWCGAGYAAAKAAPLADIVADLV